MKRPSLTNSRIAATVPHMPQGPGRRLRVLRTRSGRLTVLPRGRTYLVERTPLPPLSFDPPRSQVHVYVIHAFLRTGVE
jgi:hypothetical protein